MKKLIHLLNSKNGKNGVLYGMSFCAGLTMMSLEILSGRLLSIHVGSTFYVWGSILSVFMICMAAGYWVGGIIAESRKIVFFLFLINLFLGIFIFILPLYSNPVCQWITQQTWRIEIQALLATFLLFCIQTLLLGMLTPILIELHNSSSKGKSASRICALSTLGGVIGTLLTTFFLIGYWPTNQTLYVLAILPIGMAGLSFLFYRFSLCFSCNP